MVSEERLNFKLEMKIDWERQGDTMEHIATPKVRNNVFKDNGIFHWYFQFPGGECPVAG